MGQHDVEPYADYRRRKMEDGAEFADFIQDTFHRELGVSICVYSSRKYQHEKGESLAGVEIKLDDLMANTGNLFIEVAEKAQPRSGDYVPSGIYANDRNWLYVIGNYDLVFAFDVSILRLMRGRYRELENGTQTARGFLLPVADAAKYAAVIIRDGRRAPIAHRMKATQP